LAVVASQAFFVTERQAPPKLKELLDEVRHHCPPVVEPRILAPDMGRLAARFKRHVHGDEALCQRVHD
jgi:histidine ammonia-lyase